MSILKEKIKYYAGKSNCFVWNALSKVIKNNKKIIMFDSFLGKQYSCNPRAIYEYLLKNTNDYEFVWAFRDISYKSDVLKNKRTYICKYRSIKHYYYMIQSSCIVYNWKLTYDMPVNKKQLLIQTWHGGGCYKKAGVEIKENSSFHSQKMVEEINKANYYISSSKFFSENVIRKQNKYRGKILSIGMPRNDIFFKNDIRLKEEIRKKLGLPMDAFVILYAPTYRESIMSPSFEHIDCNLIKAAVLKKYNKKPMIIYRGHHNTEELKDSSFDMNVSDYYDMQNLLLISDMLISDYSSSIWDYSFINNPCFLYTPDLTEYEDARGFDEDIYTWGFPVCLTNNELAERIESFDPKLFNLKMKEHHEKLESYETGNATEKVCDLIINYLNKERLK